MGVEFDQAYKALVKKRRSQHRRLFGERPRDDLGHAEQLFLSNVWWPAFHHFDGLHPEYKIQDFRDGNRYIDFAYIRPHFRVAIEIDGIGSHWKDATQNQFSDHCERQNHLVIDGWYILRFTYYAVKEHPRSCQQAIQQLLGSLAGMSREMMQSLGSVDREIIHLVLSATGPVTVREVAAHTHLHRNSAIRHLKRLCEEGWLIPANASQRIHAYRINPERAPVSL